MCVFFVVLKLVTRPPVAVADSVGQAAGGNETDELNDCHSERNPSQDHSRRVDELS